MAWRCSGDTNVSLVRNLRRAGILQTDAVEDAFRRVDRKHYTVPDDPCPYADSPRPIGYNATISAPHMHAQCIELLRKHLQPGAVCLDVGSGSGYLAAIMALLVRPNGRVYGVEHVPQLVQQSIENLRKDQPEVFRENVIRIVEGDGREGLAESGPFDCIHVGAAPVDVPPALLNQLKCGGRLVLPVGESGRQALVCIDKDASGNISKEVVTLVSFVPLTDLKSQMELF